MSEQRARRETNDGRPSPEELLQRYGLRDEDLAGQQESQQWGSAAGGDQNPAPAGRSPRPSSGRRGRLRIYLAAAPGAGKTYAMLNEGHRRKSRGTDVVIGYVETHGRPRTAEQIGDLETIPRQKIVYRSLTFEEMDLEAILIRRPQVALIDELAHTNVPGSRHEKRYQDVLELLEAGIDVVTTLNIQHLESLNDIVANITGVRVRETLPDWILDQADEVELIDISPHALRQRMKHGNIYPRERIDAALNHFFREGNLTALRELALRRTAEKAEAQLQHYMASHKINKPWPACERILVGFDHRPHSRQVIRDAWRLAHSLQAQLIAVSVEPTGFAALTAHLVRLLKYGRRLRAEEEAARRRLEEHAQLAEDLGAEVLHVRSHDIAQALAMLARERHVTLIVLGLPARRRWEELLRGSLVNRLLRLSSDIDIHLVPRRPDSEAEDPPLFHA
ncbi:universal stress protein [Thermogemmatispora carboxidivorans]|uniref:universal stress protein n=1 Tax=Thermogemmatispora carboxidivorans TaxID=1382306 RepID=UPI00069C85B9|nr:universal stress protein [Thermogemmatispora carboxidivorans]